MNNNEAWDVVNQLHGAVETERYALYYVGMMDEKEHVLAALGRSLHALQREQIRETQVERLQAALRAIQREAQAGQQHNDAMGDGFLLYVAAKFDAILQIVDAAIEDRTDVKASQK